jgi:hypothetical protein
VVGLDELEHRRVLVLQPLVAAVETLELLCAPLERLERPDQNVVLFVVQGSPCSDDVDPMPPEQRKRVLAEDPIELVSLAGLEPVRADLENPLRVHSGIVAHRCAVSNAFPLALESMRELVAA